MVCFEYEHTHAAVSEPALGRKGTGSTRSFTLAPLTQVMGLRTGWKVNQACPGRVTKAAP